MSGDNLHIKMKKTVFLLLAAPLTALACQREMDTPEIVGTPITISASFDEGEAKTAYADGKTFTWLKGDKIALEVRKDGVPDVITLTAESSGSTTTFTGTIPDGYTVDDYAFYPKGTGNSYYSSDLGKVVKGTEMWLRTWGTITPDLENPLGSVPLIGKKQSDGTFRFRTACGILKVTVENIPGDAYFFQLDATDGTALNGNFSFGEDCTLYMSNVETAWPQKYVSFTPAAAGETRTFYLPIPVGTIPAGMTASIASDSRGTITLATTNKAIEIQRNKVLDLGTLTVAGEEWESIGNGTFIDNFVWPFASLTDPVTVEFQQNKADANRFRIAKPYPAEDADAWFELNVTNPQKVTSVNYYTGVTVSDETNTGVTWKAVVWNGAYGYDYSNVISTQTSGLPLEVQIGPCYRDSEGIFTSTYNYDYEVGKDHSAKVIDIIFPHVEETWTALGTGRYYDEWFWTNNSFAPYWCEVTIERSDLDANRYRINNPYTVANTAFVRTAIDGADEYMYLSVDPSTGLVTYETLRTGMDRSGSAGRNLAACHPTVWNALKGTSISAATTKVAAGTNAEPLEIQMGGVYYDNADNTHFYTNNTGLKHLYFPGWFAAETWSDFKEGGFQDALYDEKINKSAARLGTLPVTIQRSNLNANRYRIANPYRGAADASLLASTYDAYLTFTVGSSMVYFEPFRPGLIFDTSAKELQLLHPVQLNLNPDQSSRGGSYMGASTVMATATDGSPKRVQLGAFYYDVATPDFGYNYPRHTSQYPAQRIFISFGAMDTAVITPDERPMKKEFHCPVAYLDLPYGNLEKLVVKISGVDLGKVKGLRLYQGGWMDADYVAPDAEGVVTMNTFTKSAITSGIDLNCWLDESIMGSAMYLDVQEVVVDGASLKIEQDASFAHMDGVVVNNGGDSVTIGGDAVTVSSFRIPALVTSHAGTLIAAYDVRYDSSADLQGDIDVGVKRSRDGGKTWSDLIVAMDMGTYGYEDAVAGGSMTAKEAQQNNGIGDPCLLVDENTGRLFCFAVWAHGHYSDSDKRCLAWSGTGFDINGTPQLMMVTSDDDGLTWSDPVNLTPQIKQDAWRMTFQGPGRGITMKDDTLVIPIQHQEGDSKSMHNLYPLNSGIAYSKDNGATWQAHNYAHAVTSESCVAEIEPGVLMLSMRDETDSQYRRVFTTTDLGQSWTAHSTNGKVYEQSACEASLLHVDAADNALGKDLLLMSNPQGTSGWRDHITIQASLDKGQTWTHKLLVDGGASLGYSCLTMIDENTVGILYESSRGSIFFQAVPLTAIVSE